jgi:hypothetical protein
MMLRRNNANKKKLFKLEFSEELARLIEDFKEKIQNGTSEINSF